LEQKSRLLGAWEALSRFGLGEMSIRLGTHALLIAFILLAGWGLRTIYQYGRNTSSVKTGDPSQWKLAEPMKVEKVASLDLDMPDFVPASAAARGINRQAHLHTDVPSRPREDVIQYAVKQGDTLFGIATQFGLKPETILWSNQLVLGDNPHNLRPGQTLNILPVNGAYHRWSAGDGLNGVAKFFGVAPDAIINFPGNHLDPNSLGDLTNPNIQPGTWLVVPGGQRAFVSWSAPVIPLDNPGVAKVLGPGACTQVSTGVVGTGTFIWPADNHYLSGYDYEPGANHPGIDISGNEGNPAYAADSGIVVYAGWNNWGYGNVVVINHSNGWQTLYAHLSALWVTCGQIVSQGKPIGAIGQTGNADGPHLHYEMMYNGVRVNPHDYVR
jgi:murein DD-endopeptidase MepM/ murein hydrolase activator NlpD